MFQPKRLINFMVVVGKSEENADRLLGDIQAEFEYNQRLIADFGQQKNDGGWQEGEFKTKSGVKFLACGRGQSPRGLRDREARPDYIVIDDIDDDQLCRNDETSWKRDNKQAGIATEANGLTKEQTDAIKEANALNEKSRSKAIEDANKEALKDELLAMTDYLKEYGTIQEQKYAIAKEYADKIKEVNDGAGTAEEKKWKVKALEKQRDAAMGQADAKSLAMNIDWGATFDGVGNVLKDVARETLGKVEAYMKTAELKALSAENKKTYTDLQAKLKQETGGESTSAFNFKIWGTISNNVTAYQESVRTLRDKTEKAQRNLRLTSIATEPTLQTPSHRRLSLGKDRAETRKTTRYGITCMWDLAMCAQ